MILKSSSVGKNGLKTTGDTENESLCYDGIVIVGDVTIHGEGSLDIDAANGIDVYEGDVVIEGIEGTINTVWGGISVEYGNLTISDSSLTITDDNNGGIAVDGNDLVIESSEVKINTGDSGVFMDDGTLTICDGTELDITTEYSGIYVYGSDIVIEDSTAKIDTLNWAIYSDIDSSITIRGEAVLNIVSEWTGFCVENTEINIESGTVTVDTYERVINTVDDESTLEINIADGVTAYDSEGNVIENPDYETLSNLAYVRFEDASAPAIEGAASIGTQGYATLQDAVNAAKTGDTITLLANIEGTYTIDSGKFTLDLNGKVLKTTNAAPLTIQDSADVTITDSDSGSDSCDGHHAVAVINHSGSNNSTEHPGYLFDSNPATKWCSNYIASDNAWVIFKFINPTRIKSYTLVPSGDTATYPTRN